MVFMGIDPGKKGGIGMVREDKGHACSYAFDADTLIKILNNCKVFKIEVKAMVENVHAMPNQGVVSMFSFGQNFGEILGILKAFDVDTELVAPSKWKKAMNVTSDKATSISACNKLFPTVDLKPSSRSKKDSDGMAEALLIAEYNRRQHLTKK